MDPRTCPSNGGATPLTTPFSIDCAATTTAPFGIFIVSCSQTKSRSRMMDGSLNVPLKIACPGRHPSGFVGDSFGTADNAEDTARGFVATDVDDTDDVS